MFPREHEGFFEFARSGETAKSPFEIGFPRKFGFRRQAGVPAVLALKTHEPMDATDYGVPDSGSHR